MKEGYAFVVYAEVKEEQESVFPEKTVCYMGLKKSAFKFEASLTDKKTIQNVVQTLCFWQKEIRSTVMIFILFQDEKYKILRHSIRVLRGDMQSG